MNAHQETLELRTAGRGTLELTGRVLEVLPLVEWARALDRNFPRHYREQCRGVLALARRTDRNILLQAAQRLLDHDCVSYGNLKKTVKMMTAWARMMAMTRLRVAVIRK